MKKLLLILFCFFLFNKSVEIKSYNSFFDNNSNFSFKIFSNNVNKFKKEIFIAVFIYITIAFLTERFLQKYYIKFEAAIKSLEDDINICTLSKLEKYQLNDAKAYKIFSSQFKTDFLRFYLFIFY